jgi:glutaminyl-tRNA synthetase
VAAGKNGGRSSRRFPARAERLPAHRPRQGRSASTSASPANSAATATCASTTPIRSRKDVEYVDSIKDDVQWLGFHWHEREYYASDYYEQLYQFAEDLIRKGVAYVDSLSADEIREHRGTLTEPGKDSPYRTRGIDENLDLFRRMRAAEFPTARTSCARRSTCARPTSRCAIQCCTAFVMPIITVPAARGAFYPMYDFAHPLSDAIEGVTHSFCTLEYVDHRPLYDWAIEHAGTSARPAASTNSRAST